jgi:hypothetical protein
MRRRHCSTVLCAAAVLWAGAATAQDATELTAGGLFLLLPVGARAVATGQAAAADAGSSESVFWNPAGLATISETEFAIHHYNVFAGNGDALAGVIPTARLGTFGLVFYQLDYGTIDVTGSGGGEPLGRVSARNLAFIASYGTDLPAGFTFGLNFKLIQTRTDCSGSCAGVPTAAGTTQAVDIGTQRAFGAGDRLRLGLVIQNLGLRLQVNNQPQADPLPTRVRIGAVYRFVIADRADSTRDVDVRVLADVDDEWASYGSPEARFGVDGGLGSLVRIRAGYAFTTGTSRGVGLGLGLRVGSLAVDLARTILTDSELQEQEPTYVSFRLLF